MQNKSATTTTNLKQREDAGWLNLRRQLDIDMPQKKKDRRFIWFFLLAGIGWGGYSLFNFTNAKSSLPVTPIQFIDSSDKTNPELASTHKTNNLSIPKSQNSDQPDTHGTVDLKKSTDASEINTSAPPSSQAGIVVPKTKKNIAQSKNQTFTNKVNSSAIQNKSKENKKPGTSDNKKQSLLAVSTSTDMDLLKSGDQLLAQKAADSKLANAAESSIVQHKAGSSNMVNLKRDVVHINHHLIPIKYDERNTLSVHMNELSKQMQYFNDVNSPILLAATDLSSIRNKPIFFAQLGNEYFKNRLWSLYPSIGLEKELSSKWYTGVQTGLAFYLNHVQIPINEKTNASFDKNSIPATPQSTGGSSAKINLDSYTAKEKTAIGLDATFNGFRNDTLFINSSDQISYYKKPGTALNVNWQVGYRLNKHWILEGGLNFRTYIKPGSDYIDVKRNGALALNNSNSTTNYTLLPSTFANQFSAVFSAGYKLNSRIYILSCFRSGALSKTINKSTDPFNTSLSIRYHIGNK